MTPDNSKPFTRRQALSAVAVAGAGTIAGCSQLPGFSSDPSPPERNIPADWHPQPGQWPMQNYDYGNSRYNPFASPPRTSPSTAWTYSVGGDPITSLIVADEAVVARTGTGLTAVRKDGSLWWEKTRERPGVVQYLSGRLYDISRGSLAALGVDGTERWSTSVEYDRYQLLERNGWIYLVSREQVLRLHADTGEKIAPFDVAAYPPTTAGGPVYSGMSSVAAYDVSPDGFSQRWSVKPEGPYELYAAPVVGRNRLYRPERALPGTDAPTGRVGIYDTQDGSRVGGVSFEQTPRTPAATETLVFIPTSTSTARTVGQKGKFTAATYDGSVLWNDTPDVGLCPPVSSQETVYVGPVENKRGGLKAFDHATGRTLWERDVHSLSALAIAGNRLYYSENGTVFALKS